jgi:hypothetical protein
MRSKFSSFVLASTALAAVAFATLPAVAATTSTTLNVPFGFTVDGRSLPAGEYSVLRDGSSNFVRLQSKDASASFAWIAEANAIDSNRVVLKFDPQGQTHALKSVQCGPLVTATLNRKSRKAEDVSAPLAPGQ